MKPSGGLFSFRFPRHTLAERTVDACRVISTAACAVVVTSFR